ncbi:MAG: hypothetical protein ACI9YL_001434, partial [Luteibaculaceae bacterium]
MPPIVTSLPPQKNELNLISETFIIQLEYTMRKIAVISCFTFLSFIGVGQIQHAVFSGTVNPEATSPNRAHCGYLAENGASKGELFLFLPGTGGAPVNYREILKHAASLGYHSLGLAYSNNGTVSGLCAFSTDTTCHGRAREEIFTGEDLHPEIDVDRANSIAQRTIDILTYFHENYPSEGWNQYFDGEDILWSKIRVAGHSQGGGHAAFIGKKVQVKRAIMFSSFDWIPLLNRSAGWVTENGQTPTSSIFAFFHVDDELLDYQKAEKTWENLGLFQFGIPLNVDDNPSPYANSHTLISEKPNANNHGSTAADNNTPYESGVPVFLPVWTYLIEGNDGLKISEAYKPELVLFPNPATNEIRISGAQYTKFK